MSRRWVALALAGWGLGASACGQSSSARALEAADRAAAEATRTLGHDLNASLDTLEARLYSGRSTVRLWAELQDRHGQVSQLACKNAEMHAESMAAIRNRHLHQLSGRKVAEAAKPAVATDAHVSGYRARAPAKPGEKGQ